MGAFIEIFGLMVYANKTMEHLFLMPLVCVVHWLQVGYCEGDYMLC